MAENAPFPYVVPLFAIAKSTRPAGFASTLRYRAFIFLGST